MIMLRSLISQGLRHCSSRVPAQSLHQFRRPSNASASLLWSAHPNPVHSSHWVRPTSRPFCSTSRILKKRFFPTMLFGMAAGTLGYSLALGGLVCLGTNVLGFLITTVTKSHKITDLVGCGTFAVAAWATHIANAEAHNLSVWAANKPLFLTLAVTAWSIRLAGFLFYRILCTGTDKRLEQFFAKEGEPWLTGPTKYPLKLLSFWVIQSAWAFLVLLPVFTAQAVRPAGAMGAWGWIGGALFMSAWAFEATADFQKNAFKNAPGNKGEFMRSGVYALCQFPNYFGEIMCWATMFFWAGFPAVFVKNPWIILSPAFTTVLLRYVSGVPPLQKSQAERYGSRADYQEYVKTTPLLIPFFKPCYAARGKGGSRSLETSDADSDQPQVSGHVKQS